MKPDVVHYVGRKTPEIRNAIFTLLRDVGFETPDFGPVSRLSKRHSGISHCVIYPESSEPRLVRLAEVQAVNSSCFATMYAGNPENSMHELHRMVNIGEKTYWMMYRTPRWRTRTKSNKGCVVRFSSGVDSKFSSRVYSIDFVTWSGRNYAIDLDPYPGIHGSGLDKLFGLREIIDLVKGT